MRNRFFPPAMIAVAAGLLAAGLFVPWSVLSARAAEPPAVADFMIMDVCVDAADAILPNLVPGDTGCTRHRDLRPGEAPPYELRNFLNPGGRCTDDGGTVVKLNRPVTRDGTTRIVSSTLNLPVSACAGARGRPGEVGEGGASIQWYDEGYGFIMGSYSPVALSIYQTPLCRDGSTSSRRFFRGWVIGPAAVPAPGGTGFGVFEGVLATGAASQLPSACPTRYRRALTTWLVAPMRFKSGRELTALVSSHFAQVSPDGLSPGATMQMEQSYWTREFGLSRWEKWARAGWIHPRSGRSAEDLAGELYRRGRCSAPLEGRFDMSPRTRFTEAPGGAARAGAYSRAIVDPQTGATTVWYMTLCEDYTNIHPRPAAKAAADVSAIADRAYWAP